MEKGKVARRMQNRLEVARCTGHLQRVLRAWWNGRHARLRIWSRKGWRFKSSRVHRIFPGTACQAGSPVEPPPAVEAFDAAECLSSTLYSARRRGDCYACHGARLWTAGTCARFCCTAGRPKAEFRVTALDAKQKRRRAAAVQGVRFKGKSQARLEVQKCWGLTEPRC